MHMGHGEWGSEMSSATTTLKARFSHVPVVSPERLHHTALVAKTSHCQYQFAYVLRAVPTPPSTNQNSRRTRNEKDTVLGGTAVQAATYDWARCDFESALCLEARTMILFPLRHRAAGCLPSKDCPQCGSVLICALPRTGPQSALACALNRTPPVLLACFSRAPASRGHGGARPPGGGWVPGRPSYRRWPWPPGATAQRAARCSWIASQQPEIKLVVLTQHAESALSEKNRDDVPPGNGPRAPRPAQGRWNAPVRRKTCKKQSLSITDLLGE
jgi:hypothetical protein